MTLCVIHSGMSQQICSICQKPKAGFQCGLCQALLCKGCAHLMDADSFLLMVKIPEALAHAAYCTPCFDQQVAGPLAAYQDQRERAENVYVFTKSQSKESRLIKRKLPTIRIEGCDDHDETVMRLAFAAIGLHCNAIVDVDVVGKKVTDGAYQTTKYRGAAIPVTVDPGKMESDMQLANSNPN